MIASDSQESDDEDVKRLGVRKTYDTDTFGFTDAEIAMGGAGSNAFISRAVKLMKEGGYTPFFTRPREVAAIAEDAMGEMTKRYWCGPDGKGLDVELLLAV